MKAELGKISPLKGRQGGLQVLSFTTQIHPTTFTLQQEDLQPDYAQLMK